MPVEAPEIVDKKKENANSKGKNQNRKPRSVDEWRLCTSGLLLVCSPPAHADRLPNMRPGGCAYFGALVSAVAPARGSCALCGELACSKFDVSRACARKLPAKVPLARLCIAVRA